jgi:uncharacterized protein with PQ loop repeat
VTEFVGWCSSLILLSTLIVQIRKQWKTSTNEGVSKWLFVGQLAASVGFVIYSVLSENVVFAVTNGVLSVSNAIGIYIFFRNRRQGEVTK